MNSIHNNGEHDSSLDNGLDKLDRAYAHLPDEQPPELLDQAILNKAHRAVEKQSHWMQFGWLHGLTTAAVVVLAISLVFNQREQMPGLENDLRLDESIPLQRERTAKTKSDEASLELKEKRESPQDEFRGAPSAASPPGEPKKTTVGDQAAATSAQVRRSTEGVNLQQLKSQNADRDVSANEPVIEAHFSNEDVLPSETPELEIGAKQSLPATVAADLAEEVDDFSGPEDEITKQLQEIILLKQAGDESWLTELQKFRQNHPDYPLPEELAN